MGRAYPKTQNSFFDRNQGEKKEEFFFLGGEKRKERHFRESISLLIRPRILIFGDSSLRP